MRSRKTAESFPDFDKGALLFRLSPVPKPLAYYKVGPPTSYKYRVKL